MHSHEITRQFVELGRTDALSHDPTDELDEGQLWHRASRVVRARMEPCEVGPQVQLAACWAYRKGWMWSHREMTTGPHLRITSHLWTIGYRCAEDRERLTALLELVQRNVRHFRRTAARGTALQGNRCHLEAGQTLWILERGLFPCEQL